ncbi:unnamed protein product, partial [Prunus brigantina]
TLAKAQLTTSVVGLHNEAIVLTCHLHCRLPPQSHDTFLVDLHCVELGLANLLKSNVFTLLDDIRYETTLDSQGLAICKGDSKGIIVSRNITFGELLERVHKIVNRDNREDKLCLKFSVSISSNKCKHIKIEDNGDVKFFIKYICEVIPSKVAPLLVSIEDRGVTNVVDMIDFTRVEGMHSGDNGTEMNGLQMHSAPPILAHLETFSQVGVVGFGTTSELSIRHNWRQMGEQNVHNLGIVNDEEEDIESAYSRNNWDPKLEVGKIFSSKEALSNKLQLAVVRGHFEFKVKQSCKSRLVVVCSQGPCLCASSYGENNFIIMKYNPIH